MIVAVITSTSLFGCFCMMYKNSSRTVTRHLKEVGVFSTEIIYCCEEEKYQLKICLIFQDLIALLLYICYNKTEKKNFNKES